LGGCAPSAAPLSASSVTVSGSYSISLPLAANPFSDYSGGLQGRQASSGEACRLWLDSNDPNQDTVPSFGMTFNFENGGLPSFPSMTIPGDSSTISIGYGYSTSAGQAVMPAPGVVAQVTVSRLDAYRFVATVIGNGAATCRQYGSSPDCQSANVELDVTVNIDVENHGCLPPR
jgi:hypothetical protein